MESIFPRVCAICRSSSASEICPSCLAFRWPTPPIRIPSIQRVHYLAPYQSPLGQSVRRAKQNGNRWVFQKIGRWMGAHAAENDLFGSTLTVVPVPSPWNRKLRRGFNPSAVLASQIAAALRQPVIRSLSIRPGQRQARLNRVRRSQNVSERLRTKNRVAPRILLVDDVSTTGSTAQACAEALRLRGAREILLYVPCVTRLEQN